MRNAGSRWYLAMSLIKIKVFFSIILVLLMMAATTLVFTCLAQERGSKEVRQRAEAALLQMTPGNLFRCGLTCDYTSECMSFLRANFDIDDPDPAVISFAAENFCQRMKRLFLDAMILGDAPSIPASAAVPASSAKPHATVPVEQCKTVSQIVYEQVQDPEPTLGCVLWRRGC